jgi:uncharacterized protein YjbJ (UPF0337 family)
MNWHTVEGQWKEVKGKIRSKWGKLTDDDVSLVAGKRDALLGRIEQRYGVARDEAERQVDEWVNQL